ncbi:MAG: PQQ-dependent sugar dehydrogenase, partial [Candidatus Latescibacteria bacterium]|nr:PQQ-dependent sugar dehydrogenase [Candidatus Latescibacterota bacterium]
VSLFLDIPLDGDGPNWVTGDHAFSFVADLAYPDDGIWWRHGDTQGHQEVPAPPQVRMAVQLQDKGYTLEAAIPMAVLSRLAPEWKPPFEERVVGFMFIATDPDGGPDPFGGELIYGGDNDDDSQWARLRLVAAGTAQPPHLEVPIPGDPTRRTAIPRIAETLKDLSLPPGFRVNLFASVPGGPNRLRWGPDGRLYVTEGGWGAGKKLWTLEDTDRDGIAEKRQIFIDGLDTPLGMAFRGTDLYVTHRTGGKGKVSLYRDTDGDGRGEWVQDIVTGLNQGHGVGNIVLGPDDRFYVGQGSTGDLSAGSSPRDATIFRVDSDGQNIQVVAKGLRNAYGFAFDRQGRLFATDNGPNHLGVPHHDEFNYIVEGRDYGFPITYTNPGNTEGLTPPIALFAEHASANGMCFYTGSAFPEDYWDDAFVAIWGPADPNHVDLSGEPRPPWDAYYVARLEIADTVVTRVSRFAGDFVHPNDATTGPGGELFVADWGSTGAKGSQAQADGDGAVYRIVYEASTAVEDEETKFSLPQGISLIGVPNPFNPSTLVSYTVPEAGEVRLRVYNLQGQVVHTLARGWAIPGKYQVVWSGTDEQGRRVGSGIYLVRLEVDSGIARTWKAVLLR